MSEERRSLRNEDGGAGDREGPKFFYGEGEASSSSLSLLLLLLFPPAESKGQKLGRTRDGKSRRQEDRRSVSVSSFVFFFFLSLLPSLPFFPSWLSFRVWKLTET